MGSKDIEYPDGSDEQALFHWAPSTRRKSIQRSGFMPGSLSVGREWRPPFVCFSGDPLLAWQLSGDIHPEVVEWDLWMVWKHDAGTIELLFDRYIDTNRLYIKEYRVYERIYKRHVHYIASRVIEPR